MRKRAKQYFMDVKKTTTEEFENLKVVHNLCLTQVEMFKKQKISSRKHLQFPPAPLLKN